MSAFLDIEKALLKGVKDLNLAYPTSEPNRELTNEQKQNGLWLKVSVLNAETNVATLGRLGEDNNPGVLQIDVNELQNQGTGELLKVCDIIASAFYAGKDLLHNAQAVTIRGSSISGIRNVGGYARRTVSVRWYSRTRRLPYIPQPEPEHWYNKKTFVIKSNQIIPKGEVIHGS